MRFKKATALFIIMCVVVTMIMPVNAAVSKSISDKANTLNRLTVLRGNGIDYNLDGQLVRGEAAAFIVRLMGKEAKVLADSAKLSVTSYKDVDKNAWYAPYIGYCSQAGIINGYPNGNYGPNDNISEKAFLKLVLGALGYEYNVYFNWTNLYRKAYDVGLVDDPNYQSKDVDNINYTRSSVVSVLYNSLNRVNRKTKTTIIENLVEQKVVDRSIAVSEGFIKDSIITAISSVGVIDMNTIRIRFNESVKTLSNSDIQIYESQNTSTKLSVSIKSQSADELVITTSAQVPDKGYTVLISDVSDLEKNLSDVTGSFTGYKSVEVNSGFFRINKIEAFSKNVINIFFTQPINMNAELPMYYEILEGNTTYVKGSFQTTSVKLLAPYDNVISIFIKEKDLLDGAYYTLKISGDLYSLYGAKMNNGSGDIMGFTAKASANQDFYVTNVIPVNKKYIKVQFNKDIDAATAQVFTNYALEDSNEVPCFISKVVVTSEGVYKNKEVTLQVANLLDSTKTYELTINNVYDSFKQIKLSTDEDEKYQLVGVSTAVEDLAIVNVFAEDKGTLNVYFNKPLGGLTATDRFRYTLIGVTDPAYSVNPSSVYYDSVLNPYMVKLTIPGDAVTSSKIFKLKVDGVMQDYMGETTNETYYTFNGTSTDNVKPYMVEALIISNDTIKVLLNEEIASGIPNTLPTNYSLEYKDGSNTVKKNPTSVGYINAKTLSLKFESLEFSKQYTLKFTDRLVDYSGVNARLSSDNANGISVYVAN